MDDFVVSGHTFFFFPDDAILDMNYNANKQTINITFKVVF